MKFSRSFLPTLKEIPADAVAKSHKLMLRAGMIRSLGAGIYSYLPYFWKSLNKAIAIVREEMNAVGAQEFLLPALNPVEIWEESGRQADFGPEKFNFQDRKKHLMTLAPTHEEIICDIARKEIRSYKELPQVWYQIQTKFRDEPRPRSGVLRTRQFIMKDAYSLTASWDDLDKCYDDQKEAYKRIFSRCGLEFFIVGASTGLMGGRASQEFMVESSEGEDICAVCDSCEYAANVEVAESKISYKFGEGGKTPQEVHTPDKRTIEEVAEYLQKKPENFLKALLYIAEDKPIMALLCGHDELSEAKLSQKLGCQVRPAEADEVMKFMQVPVGFIGPVGLSDEIPLLADENLRQAVGMVCGANKSDYHLIDVDLGVHTREPEFAGLRTVNEGEGCPECGKPLRVVRAIEMGHIFKLGTKYSDAMGATFLDTNGKPQPIIMGSYGIGLERIVAANIELWADEAGLNWRGEIIPHRVLILPLNVDDENTMKAANGLYNELNALGYDPAIDDRKQRPGVKFKDADLLGFPLQIVFGRDFKDGKVELKNRSDGNRSVVPLVDIMDHIKKIDDDNIGGKR